MRLVRLIILLATALAAAAVGSPPWREAAPGHRWSLPTDLYAHREYRTEWWYFTGHLQPRKGDPQGILPFQLTFFRLGMIPDGRPLPQADWAASGGLMAHAALTDPATGLRVFSEVLWRETPLLAGFGAPGDSTLAWCRAPGGTGGTWRLTHQGQWFGLHVRDDRQGLAYDLRCRPLKPLVLHGTGGFSAKHAGGAPGSLYASYTRMEVIGSVLIGGNRTEVSGQCWMDREIFSDSLAPDQTGWDWVSLQLADDREVMLYRLFGPTEAGSHASGTLIDRDGSARTLTVRDWDLQPLATWRSPKTGAQYPVAWRLRIPQAGLDLRLGAVVEDQENRSRRSGVHYWEGAVSVTPWAEPSGASLGQGFIEMTGYGKGSRPPV